MKVVIDLSPLRSGHQYRGIGVYTKNLYKALQKYDPENEYVLTTKTFQAKADVIHYPFFDFYFLTLPFNKQANTVITIHDVIPLMYKKEYPAGVKGKLKYRVQKLSLQGVKKIITDSDQSKQDIIEYLHQPASKVERVYLAADEKFKPQKKSVIDRVKQKYGLNNEYLLYVGDINYNKNLLSLLQAYHQAQIPQDLVLVCKALSTLINESTQIHELIHKLDLDGKVKILTQVPLNPVEELAALYSGAHFYIQPSLYEGFGLPVLEAWACHTPVLSSTGGSLREVVDDAAITFDPTDIQEMKSKIEIIAHLKISERKKSVDAGRNRLKEFHWQKTAKQMVRVYKDLVHE